MTKTRILLPAMLVLLLVGCSAQTGSNLDITQQKHGLPAALKPAPGTSDDSPSIHWTSTEHDSLTFVSWGSSSCPVTPVTYQLEDPTHLTLTTKKYDGACTADLGPTTVVFKTPTGLSDTKNVVVTVHDGNDSSHTDATLTLKATPTLADL